MDLYKGKRPSDLRSLVRSLAECTVTYCAHHEFKTVKITTTTHTRADKSATLLVATSAQGSFNQVLLALDHLPP